MWTQMNIFFAFNNSWKLHLQLGYIHEVLVHAWWWWWVVITPSWLEVGPLAAFSLWSPNPLGAISTSNSVSQWLYQQLKGLTRAPLETVNFFQKSLGKNSNLQHILIFNSSCPKAPDSGDQSKSRSTNSESSLGRLDCFNQNVSWKVCILSIWLQHCSFIWREHEPNYNN